MAAFDFRQATEIRDAFKLHGVTYLFIGKCGAILLGFPDTTQDADVFVLKSPENGTALVAALRGLGFALSTDQAGEIERGSCQPAALLTLFPAHLLPPARDGGVAWPLKSENHAKPASNQGKCERARGECVEKFRAPGQLVAFAALGPVVRQSGEFQGSRRHVSKLGSPFQRRTQFQMALRAAYTEGELQEYSLRKRRDKLH